MLTDAAIRERMDAVKTPLSLCDHLELKPTPRQREVLGILTTLPSFYEVVGDDRNEMTRAALVFALWRILTSPSSSGVILAAGKGADGKAMDFLAAVTQKINPQLADVTGFPQWNVLRIHGQPSWELRVLPNEANLVRERARGALVSVILGGKSSDPAFVEACDALGKACTNPKNTRIFVW